MKFGCLKETPSIRNYDYDVVCGSKNITIPKEFMLSDDRLPKVRNQGNVAACVAFSCVEIMEVLNRMEFSVDKTFSAGFFYGYNRSKSADYSGMYPSQALNYCLKTGSVPEMYFDELKEMPEMRKLVCDRDDLVKIAEKYRISGYCEIKNPRLNADKVKKALVEKNYPLLAVSEEYFGASHAVIIIGFNNQGYVIQNSWGEEWGENGRRTVPYTAINYVYVLTDEVFEMNFKDVPEDAWYYNAVKETVFNGLMKGKTEDVFDPEAPITRGEMAQLCVNLCKKLDEILKQIR